MIGQIDDRVSLQHKTLADDGAGGATATFTQYAQVWANVTPMTGREREQAMRNESRSNYLVTIRRRADVKPSDRIEWRGRFLNVRFIKDAGPRVRYLEMECELGAPA